MPWIEKLLDFMTEDVANYEDAYRRLKHVSANNNDVSNKSNDSYRGITFATLNYDRLIEISLLNYFIHKYPSEEAKIHEDFTRNGDFVRHLHGGLGCLRDRPFGMAQPDRLPRLQFWFEKTEEPRDFPIMNTMIELSSSSVFLGFGFHDSIMKRFCFNERKPQLYITDACNDLGEKIGDFLSNHSFEQATISTGYHCCSELIEELILGCKNGMGYWPQRQLLLLPRSEIQEPL